MTMYFWLAWVQAFLIVVAVLMVGAAVHEYLQWRKGE
jgi:hypothetical protein